MQQQPRHHQSPSITIVIIELYHLTAKAHEKFPKPLRLPMPFEMLAPYVNEIFKSNTSQDKHDRRVDILTFSFSSVLSCPRRSEEQLTLWCSYVVVMGVAGDVWTGGLVDGGFTPDSAWFLVAVHVPSPFASNFESGLASRSYQVMLPRHHHSEIDRPHEDY